MSKSKLLQSLVFLASLALTQPALAGSGTVAITPGAGATYATTTDGSGNNYGRVTLWDFSAGANGASIDAQHGLLIAGEGTAGAATGGVLSVQGVAAMTPLLVTLQASAGTAIGKVDPNTLASWGLAATTQNVAVPTNGLVVMGQFTTTPTTLATTNVSPLQLDNAGNLLVNIKAGAGSGGTALADEGTFTQGTTSFTPSGCFFANAITNLTTGQGGAVQCTNDRNLFVNVNKWAGTAITAVPTAYGTAPTGTVPGFNAFVTNSNANGQATMANSSPVVIASNQSAVPVTLTSTTITGTVAAVGPTAVGSANANPPVVIGGTATGAAGANVQGLSIVATSVAPVTATNTAVVVDLRPDSPGIITLGPATAANSVPVTIGPTLLGSYCMGASTGTMAAGLAAGSPIYSFRYGGANLAIVRKVSLEADDVTTAFVAGTAQFNMFAARSFTASDTGGTAATLTGNNGKLRTSFATTAVSDLRISSTATLTAGTRTLDAQPLASISFAISTNIDAVLLPTTDLVRQNVGESPIVLAANEGFVIQATVPGTGTWFTSVRTCWDEVSAF